VFVLRTGISWNALPQELGCGSGVTCWRRLREWQQVGVWQRLHRVVLDRLAQQGLLDWSRAAVDIVTANTPDAPVVPAGARTSCTPTRATTTPRCRRYLARRGIGVRIARRGIEGSTRLGRGPLGRRAHHVLAAGLPPPGAAL
jgi:transposase